MGSRVFRFTVTCYFTCILCRNAFGRSSHVKVYPSVNDTSQENARVLKIRDTRAEQSIEMETRSDKITLSLMDNSPKFETSRESQLMQDPAGKTKISSDFQKVGCSTYCLQELGTEDINFSWSFAGNQSKGDNLLLENNANVKILEYIPTDNKDSTILHDCLIYFNFGCDIINMRDYSINQFDKQHSNLEFNQQRIKSSEDSFRNNFSESKVLVHRTNLSEYTETDFDINANVTEIVMNLSENLTRVILSIPTKKNRTMPRLGITMSLPLIYTRGMVIGARNLPPGGWCVKLTGAENLKYNFDVIAYFATNEENDTRNHAKLTSEFNQIGDLNGILNEEYITENKITTLADETQFNELEKKVDENNSNNQINSILLVNPAINKKPKSIFERSAGIMELRNKNDDEAMIDFSDLSLSSLRSTTVQNLINYSVLRNNSVKSYGFYFKNPQNPSDNKTFNGKIFASDQQQKIQARSSEVSSLNEDIGTSIKFPTNNNISMQIINNDQTQELQLDRNNDDPFERKRILLDINVNSNLIATPGTTHRVIFDVTNNCVLNVRYAIRARSSPLRIINIQPVYMQLYPGQTSSVAVDILVPLGTQDTVNPLTLFIDNTEIPEKTVYIYVQTAFTKVIDNIKPTIGYLFNSNCAGKLDRDQCEKTIWSADITVQDPDSGLKRVVSTPNGIYQRRNYISGTKERVHFYYASTCCSTTATITAIDISENQYTRTLDVTAWDNLSQGEIAAIVLGALLILFLLIIIIVAIVFCIRKRDSRDLPYTQRYGSRPPARSERTSF